MVSTRGVRLKFSDGERVLCYEPDPTKAKVLYASKVVGIIETKDKRGKKVTQYKIHFQGWNSSWDRRVNADFVLKDTEENRQLQKDLAEKAQLQLAAYLYRREKRKRSHESSSARKRLSSEDGSSCSPFDKNDSEDNMRYDYDSESSSLESCTEEGRLHLQIGEKLKQILDHDRNMIRNKSKLHILPAGLPAVTVLENFVKHSALKLIFSSQTPYELSRRRNNNPTKREENFEKLNNMVCLLKEVADSLRIYLDFTLKGHLLYEAEKEQAMSVLSEENLKNFTYIASEEKCPDFLNVKLERCDTPKSELSEPQSTNSDNLNPDENSRRRLRSYRVETEFSPIVSSHNVMISDLEMKCAPPVKDDNNLQNEIRSCSSDAEFKKDENDLLVQDSDSVKLENHTANDAYISSIASVSSNGSALYNNVFSGNINFTKHLSNLSTSVSVSTREFLQEIFAWRILPSNAPVEASMVYGAAHLTRLIVKLPDFINLTHMSEEKLNLMIPLVNSFIKYLESHKEWFGEHLYKDAKLIHNTQVKPKQLINNSVN